MYAMHVKQATEAEPNSHFIDNKGNGAINKIGTEGAWHSG
jgi:hypothetical protein